LAIKFIEEVKSFGGSVVIKQATGLKNQVRNERGGSFVTVVNEDDLGTANYPMVLQKYVPKKYEVRVTIAGDRVFSCKINSQDSPNNATRIDWRIYDFENVKFTAMEIPSDIKEKCIRLTKMLGLKYSAMDFIYDPDGNYWFLEVNPNGLWMWIEQLSGLPISEAIADLLIT